jgi:hypothetical protein
MITVIGFSNFITFKICSTLVVKPEAAWTATERASVEGYREFKQLEKISGTGQLAPEMKPRLDLLRERDARGELHGHITLLEPWSFSLGYTLVIGIYLVLGGMKATAINEVVQSILILVFSVILIPVGVSAIGGWHALGEKVPAAMFELVSSDASSQQVTLVALLAILLVAIVQINGISVNMSIGGSATDEFAARLGVVAGTYGKRIMTIMWTFCGLIAVALYYGANALADPDTAWGMMSRQLLGPGLLGLMLTGVLAAEMSAIATQTISISALVVRNCYRPLLPKLSEAGAVKAGRWTVAAVLGLGIVMAMGMTNIFAVIQFVQTVNVPFGAAIMLIFFWRRLTVPAVWAGVLIAIAANIVLPLTLSRVEAVRTHPALVARSQDAQGRPVPVFFDAVVRVRPEDPASPLEGRGRFHLELYVLRVAGMDIEAMQPSNRFAARFFFDAISPFLFLFGLSWLTRSPPRERVDRFYGKMKTPVAATAALDADAMAETERAPHRFDHLKLFPHSSWEFTKWNRVDAIGFLVCCAVTCAIIALFLFLLRLAAP